MEYFICHVQEKSALKFKEKRNSHNDARCQKACAIFHIYYNRYIMICKYLSKISEYQDMVIVYERIIFKRSVLRQCDAEFMQPLDQKGDGQHEKYMT